MLSVGTEDSVRGHVVGLRSVKAEFTQPFRECNVSLSMLARSFWLLCKAITVTYKSCFGPLIAVYTHHNLCHLGVQAIVIIAKEALV
jgi:hypothetical protein